MWRRAQPAEPAIYRDDVLVIMGALADIKAWTWEILRIVKEEDEGEEDVA